jgi:hypothetical protein
MTIATWKLPFGKSALSCVDFNERKKHYNFSVVNKLNNGKRVIPCDQTIKYIFDSSDMFGLEVAISSGSYIVINENDIVGNYAPDLDAT